jgi:hypothetical protein
MKTICLLPSRRFFWQISLMMFVRKALAAILLLSITVLQAGVPLFTTNYYLVNPNRWLGKNVSLAVSYLTIPNTETRKDGLRVLVACTNNGGELGGNIGILCSQAEAERLINLCGTDCRKWRTHNIVQGVFTEDKDSLLHMSHYFLLIK